MLSSPAKMKQFARWADQPGPSGFWEVHLSTPRIHLAQICQSPSTEHLHTAAVYHRAHISLPAASRTKRERLCFHHRRGAQVHGNNKIKWKDNPDTWPPAFSLAGSPQTWTQENRRNAERRSLSVAGKRASVHFTAAGLLIECKHLP